MGSSFTMGKNASYLSLIASELFKDANLLPMCFYLCLFFVFISIAACLHWCGIAEEIKVDIVSSFLSPHLPAVSSPSDLVSVVFYISVFFLEVAAALSHYVSTSCVSAVITYLCVCLAVVSLSLSLYPPSLGCLSKSLPQRMRSFLRTTPLRRPPHISGAPGEENVAFLRGATQIEQSLQEKQTAN